MTLALMHVKIHETDKKSTSVQPAWLMRCPQPHIRLVTHSHWKQIWPDLTTELQTYRHAAVWPHPPPPLPRRWVRDR